MKLSVLTLCVLGAYSMSAYASTNIVNAQSQFLMSYNGNKDDSSNVRKNGVYCETRTIGAVVHNYEQDKTYQGVGIKKIDKVTGTYQTVCIKDGKETSWPSYTQTYVNDIVYEHPCTRRSTEKFEHYASDCVTSKNIYSNGLNDNAVRLMRFRGEENYDRSYSNLPSYNSVVNSCETMTLESRGTPVDACEVKPNGINGTPDVIRIEDISTDNSVATIRITDNKNTTDATINYKSTKINLSKEWLNQLERVTIKNAKAKDWMFVTLKNPAGANAGVETVLQMPYIRGAEEPPRLYLCEGSQNFNWGQRGIVEGSKVQDLSLIFNGVAGYKNIPTTGDLSISQYSCEVDPDRTGTHLEKARFPIVQGRHWEMNGGALRATWDEPERVEGSHGFLINGVVGQFLKDFQTRQCNHNAYQATEDKEICKLGGALHPFIYNASNQRKGIERNFDVYVKPDILPLLQQGFNNIEILTIGRDKNMELTLEFTFKGNKPSISKKIEDEKNNCYGRGHDASCNEQDNENDNNTGGYTPMIPPHELDPNKDYTGWIGYYCDFGQLSKKMPSKSYCENHLKNIPSVDMRSHLLREGDFGDIKNTGLNQHEHDTIVYGCKKRSDIYGLLTNKEKEFQLECEKEFHPRFTQCLKDNSDNYGRITGCFRDEEKNIQSWSPKNILKDIVQYQCDHLYTGKEECKKRFNKEIDNKQFTCSQGATEDCAKTLIKHIKGFQPSNDTPQGKNSDYIGWIDYQCNKETAGERDILTPESFRIRFNGCRKGWINENNLVDKIIGGSSYPKDLGHNDNTGIFEKEHKEIVGACNNLLESYEDRLGQSIKYHNSPQQLSCRTKAHKKYRACLDNHHEDYDEIVKCFSQEKTNINNYAPAPLSEPLIDKYCSEVAVGETECRAKFTKKYADYTCQTGELSNCINTIINEIKSFKPNDHYDNNKTTYDGWFSYVCTGNGQQDCIRDFKKDYERYTFKKDLESKLLGKLTNGLLGDDNKTIQDGCHTRNSDLKNKQGRYLESICSDEIIKKYQDCLKENKADLQTIRTCFTNKKNKIKNWYNEEFMIDYAQSKCNDFHKEHLEQCTAHFNRDYIKNFMEYYKDRIEGVIFSLKEEYLPILDNQINDFKPVLQGESNLITPAIRQNITNHCMEIKNLGQGHQIVKRCINDIQHKYINCLKTEGFDREGFKIRALSICRNKIKSFRN